MNKKLMIMLSLLALSSLPWITSLQAKPAPQQIPRQIHRTGVWGPTWVCPNPKCGYENYEGVKYCGLCGTKHP